MRMESLDGYLVKRYSPLFLSPPTNNNLSRNPYYYSIFLSFFLTIVILSNPMLKFLVEIWLQFNEDKNNFLLLIKFSFWIFNLWNTGYVDDTHITTTQFDILIIVPEFYISYSFKRKRKKKKYRSSWSHLVKSAVLIGGEKKTKMDRETKSETARIINIRIWPGRFPSRNISNRNIGWFLHCRQTPPLSPVFEVFALVRWPNEYRLPRTGKKNLPRPRLIVHPLTG